MVPLFSGTHTVLVFQYEDMLVPAGAFGAEVAP